MLSPLALTKKVAVGLDIKSLSENACRFKSNDRRYKMGNKEEQLPWDYFLTNYERDLLRLQTEDMMRKYPDMSQTQLYRDWLAVLECVGNSIDKTDKLIEYIFLG